MDKVSLLTDLVKVEGSPMEEFESLGKGINICLVTSGLPAMLCTCDRCTTTKKVLPAPCKAKIVGRMR